MVRGVGGKPGGADVYYEIAMVVVALVFAMRVSVGS